MADICHCGKRCFLFKVNPEQPCWGELQVTELYPGDYLHFCKGHENFVDCGRGPYKPRENSSSE